MHSFLRHLRARGLDCVPEPVSSDGETETLRFIEGASGGDGLSDVAYALRWFAPMRDDEAALEWHHFPDVPDRRARTAAFLDAYGIPADFDVADAVVRRIRHTSEHVRFLAAQGQEPQRTWVAEGDVEREELAEIAWIEENRSLFSD